MPLRIAVAFLALAPIALAGDATGSLPPPTREAIGRIHADSLKGHLSFLASDLLEGRASPSRGLDLAAEYIAAQFRRAGLETGGDDGYFQTARFVSVEGNREGLRVEISGTDPIPTDRIYTDNPVALTVADQPAVKFGEGVAVTGRIVFVFARDFRQMIEERKKVLAAGKPMLIVLAGPAAGRFRQRTMLVPAEERQGAVAVVSVRDDAFTSKVADAPAGDLPFRVSVAIPPPIEKPVALRNVVGILRGSDPALKDTSVLVTAHYDHLGIKAEGDDRIYNGANDDGSGVVSVIEIASALAATSRSAASCSRWCSARRSASSARATTPPTRRSRSPKPLPTSISSTWAAPIPT